MSKKISQIQIAKELGVSQSLISIVLNGRKEGIAPLTYERIWDYALKHGYSPKGMKLPEGAGLGEEQMRTVGYFLRAPLRLANKSNFFSHVAQGLHDYLREQQVNMVFLGSELDISVKELRTSAWRKKPLIGIAVMGEVHPEFLSAAREMKKPLVYISARSPGFCHSVNANEYQAAEQLVDHLYALGHRHFAFLGGMCARSRNDERLQGLIRALERYDLELPKSKILILDDGERKQGHELAEHLLREKSQPFPTAWICVNGLMARGAIGRLFQEGLRVGEDISVAAFDNTRVCSEELPALTSASAIPEDLGREAGRIILNPDLHGGDSLTDVVLPSKFFDRDSTGPVSLDVANRIQTVQTVQTVQ
ncbi:MAG TPA: LacI family DNA-binding transcriptional regulator [Oceanipulchritudo sp.]|nr:LacI family DNA-binding transcriptional regulator [Oceanipulchritudo sp.]